MDKSKRKWPVILGAVFILGFVVIMVITSGGNDKFRCQVCKTFDGRSNCFTAAAVTKTEAERTASDGACSGLTSGMSNLEQCRNSPSQVTWK